MFIDSSRKSVGNKSLTSPANAPVKRVENRAQDWIDALREYGNSPEFRIDTGGALHGWVGAKER